MRRHALLLLACPCSGATALAAALAHAGAYAGRTFVPASGRDGATWQAAALAAFNERLLAALGTRWDGLVPLPERWRERPGVRALAADADALVASEFGGAAQIVLHEPRLALTAPFWRERLEGAGFDVGCVVFVRHPAEVAAALARREPSAPEKSLALWLHYLVAAEQASRGGARVVMTFDRLLDAPAGALSLVVADTRMAMRIERAEREAALAAIRPELRRFGDGLSAQLSGLSSGIDAVLAEGYAQLARLAPGADPRRAVESIAQAAQAPLLQAIPPWLAQELAAARRIAEQHADAQRDAVERSAALQAALDAARTALLDSEAREGELRDRLDALMTAAPPAPAAADPSVGEALAQLKRDVARVATSLADQPDREARLAAEVTQLQRDLADERMTIARLSEAFEREQAAAERYAAQLADAHESLQALAVQVEQARSNERAWHEHGESLAQDLSSARGALEGVAAEREALRAERDAATGALAQLRAELDAARTDLRIVDHDRTALAARAQAVGDAAKALREELARRASAEAALGAERERLQTEGRALAERAATAERELARRIAELASLTGRHDQLGRKLAAVEKTWLGRRALAGVRGNGRA